MRSGSALLIRGSTKPIKRQTFGVTVDDMVHIRGGAVPYTSVLESYELVDTRLKLQRIDRYTMRFEKGSKKESIFGKI